MSIATRTRTGIRGEAATTRAVEEALARLATGWTWEEEKLLGEDGEGRKQETVRKTAPPDLKAIQFYLERRAPERWQAGSQENGGISLIHAVPRPGDAEATTA